MGREGDKKMEKNQGMNANGSSSTSASTRSGGTFDIEGKQARIHDLDQQSAMPAFWDDQTAAQRVLKEKGLLERVVKDYQALAELRDDPTPNLITMDERGDDVSNRFHLIKDESRRMLVRDWIYLWYLDRPTRLRPSPSAW